jgi:hypothetical protein
VPICVLVPPDCRVHHPSINLAVQLVQKATETQRIKAFNEDLDEGSLRYIQVGLTQALWCTRERETCTSIVGRRRGILGRFCLCVIWLGLCASSERGVYVRVQCTVERRTGRVQLTLVWNAEGLR